MKTDNPVFGSQNFSFDGGRKILVAEDLDTNFKLVEFFLKSMNVSVERAINGLEAVDKCRQGASYDLILMDIRMPVMDGLDATRCIREFLPDLPIIAQTAYAESRTEAIDAGCSGFLLKPFDKKKLLNVLLEYI
jgi:CheY-like chemotaxis protein